MNQRIRRIQKIRTYVVRVRLRPSRAVQADAERGCTESVSLGDLIVWRLPGPSLGVVRTEKEALWD